MTDRIVVERWIEGLRSGWVAGDPLSIAALFADNVVYWTSPFESPLVGREAVEAYWTEEMAAQESAEVTFGDPLIDGDRVAVEWWAIGSRAGAEATDSGALILEFSGEVCSRLHEYWMLREGVIEPLDGHRIRRGSALR